MTTCVRFSGTARPSILLLTLALTEGVLACIGCSQQADLKGAGTLDAAIRVREGQWFRAVVNHGPEEVPFFLKVPDASSAETTALFVNGEEEIHVEFLQAGEWISFDFVQFNTRIEAISADDGSMKGRWVMSPVFSGNNPKVVSFSATPISKPDGVLRFGSSTQSSTATSDFSGIWRTEFKKFGIAKGLLRQDSRGVVQGTIVMERISDTRFLAGNAHGNKLSLSTFDGMHSYLIVAELDSSTGAMRGEWIHANLWRDSFVAKRAEDVAIDFANQVRLKPGRRSLSSIPQLRNAPYLGRAVLVDLFGTWCPSCLDATPVLRELYQRFHADGLEILSVAYEFSVKDEYNHAQVERFRKHYGVEWEIAVVSGDPDKVEGIFPKELEGIKGLPVCIFVNRDGTVRAIRAGFAGPATGEDYLRGKREIEELVGQILASKSVNEIAPSVILRTGSRAGG